MARWWFVALVLVACKGGDGPDGPDDDADGYTAAAAGGDDCNDNDGTVHPGVEDVCDGVDNDCNGTADDGVGVLLYTDADGDGFGDPATEVEGCVPGPGQVTDNTDCDDAVGNANPGAAEACDGVDNDCDGETDESSDVLRYVDGDGDGYGDEATTSCASVVDGGDCNDANKLVNPGVVETCNGVDDDCNARVDDNPPAGKSAYSDTDLDGFGDPGAPIKVCVIGPASASSANNTDCDDTNADISPDAPERCNDLDDDCSGAADDDALDAPTWTQDYDGDTFGDDATATLVCDSPGDDWVTAGADCDDTDDTVYPDAPETCNDTDDDCDGRIDDSAVDATTFYADADKDTYGDAGTKQTVCDKPSGYVTNDDDCDDADKTAYPGATEVCDDADDDCDGTVDDSATDASTWYADSDGDDYGDATKTQKACDQPSAYVANDDDCDDADKTAYPGATETCDDVDDDCDGTADDAAVDRTTWYADADGDGYGTTATTKVECDKPSGYVSVSGDCDDSSAAYSPATVWYYDVDGDGYGDSASTKTQCASPGSKYVLKGGDCRTTDSSSYPGATEVCFNSAGSAAEGNDNDCDGSTDEACPTLHCSNITADTTWKADTYGHYIGCSINVGGSAIPTLTIDDGATVYFGPSGGLSIGNGSYGDLEVNGSTKGVSFQSYKTGTDQGYGIQIYPYSASSVISGATIDSMASNGLTVYNTSLTVEDSTIKNNSGSGIYAAGSELTVTDTTISGNSNTGLYCGGYYDGSKTIEDCLDDSAETFSGNTITGNGSYPVYDPYREAIFAFDDTNAFSGNTTDRVYLGYATITDNETWPGLDVPYEVSYVTIYDTSGTTTTPTLTLEAGADIDFSRYGSIYVGGSVWTGSAAVEYKGALITKGTAAKPVVLSSSATTPAAGDWYGVQLSVPGSATKLQGLTVEYPYYGVTGTVGFDFTMDDFTVTDALYSGINLYATDYAYDITITDCIVDTVSNGQGVYATGDAVTVDGCTVNDTYGYGIYAYAKSSLTVTDNTVDAATAYGIYVRAYSSTAIPATISNNTAKDTAKQTGWTDVSNGTGIYLGSYLTLTWATNTMSGNTGLPLYLSSWDYLSKLDTSSSYSGNDYDFIGVPGNSSSTTSDVTLTDYGVGYYINGSVYFYGAGTGTKPKLTIKDIDVRFAPGEYNGIFTYWAELAISNASFRAIDTAGEHWGAIFIQSGTTGSITNTEIADGGRYPYCVTYSPITGTCTNAYANIFATGGSVKITSSNIHDSNGYSTTTGYGIYCANTGGCASYGTDVITGNTWSNNPSGKYN